MPPQRHENPGPPMPDHLGDAGRAEWEAAQDLANAKGPGSFPWQAYAGHVTHAAEAADLVAFTTAEWEAAGRPLVTTHANGSEGPAAAYRVMAEARKAYSASHGAWAGRAERQPTTNKHGGQKGVMRAPDRVGRAAGVNLSPTDAADVASSAREALRLVREAGA